MIDDTRGLKVILFDYSSGIINELQDNFPLNYYEFQANIDRITPPFKRLIIKAEDQDNLNREFQINGDESYNKALSQISGKGLYLKVEQIDLRSDWKCTHCGFVNNKGTDIKCKISGHDRFR